MEAPRDNYIIDGGQTRSEPNQIQASFLPVRVEENPATAPSHPIDMQSEFKREGEGGRGGRKGGRKGGREGGRQGGRKKTYSNSEPISFGQRRLIHANRVDRDNSR